MNACLPAGDEDPATVRRRRPVFMAEAIHCQTQESGVRTLSDQSPRRLSSISDPDPWVPGVLRVNPPPSISASCGAESVRTFYRDHYYVTRE